MCLNYFRCIVSGLYLELLPNESQRSETGQGGVNEARTHSFLADAGHPRQTGGCNYGMKEDCRDTDARNREQELEERRASSNNAMAWQSRLLSQLCLLRCPLERASSRGRQWFRGKERDTTFVVVYRELRQAWREMKLKELPTQATVGCEHKPKRVGLCSRSNLVSKLGPEEKRKYDK